MHGSGKNNTQLKYTVYRSDRGKAGNGIQMSDNLELKVFILPS